MEWLVIRFVEFLPGSGDFRGAGRLGMNRQAGNLSLRRRVSQSAEK
jgi:hypothetical protein